MPRFLQTLPVNSRNAWLLWGVMVAASSPSTLLSHRSVSCHYCAAAQHWFAGQDLYGDDGHGFLYFPQAAILYAPFAFLPGPAGEVMWRVAIVFTFASGVWRLARVAGREWQTEFFPLATMLCMPVAFPAARAGQSTMLMAGFMMLA